MDRIDLIKLVGERWAEWYAMTPQERFQQSMKLWDSYVQLGGTLAPEPDPQSPFFEPEEWREVYADGKPRFHVVWSGGTRKLALDPDQA